MDAIKNLRNNFKKGSKKDCVKDTKARASVLATVERGREKRHTVHVRDDLSCTSEGTQVPQIQGYVSGATFASEESTQAGSNWDEVSDSDAGSHHVIASELIQYTEGALNGRSRSSLTIENLKEHTSSFEELDDDDVSNAQTLPCKNVPMDSSSPDMSVCETAVTTATADFSTDNMSNESKQNVANINRVCQMMAQPSGTQMATQQETTGDWDTVADHPGQNSQPLVYQPSDYQPSVHQPTTVDPMYYQPSVHQPTTADPSFLQSPHNNVSPMSTASSPLSSSSMNSTSPCSLIPPLPGSVASTSGDYTTRRYYSSPTVRSSFKSHRGTAKKPAKKPAIATNLEHLEPFAMRAIGPENRFEREKQQCPEDQAPPAFLDFCAKNGIHLDGQTIPGLLTVGGYYEFNKPRQIMWRFHQELGKIGIVYYYQSLSDTYCKNRGMVIYELKNGTYAYSATVTYECSFKDKSCGNRWKICNMRACYTDAEIEEYENMRKSKWPEHDVDHHHPSCTCPMDGPNNGQTLPTLIPYQPSHPESCHNQRHTRDPADAPEYYELYPHSHCLTLANGKCIPANEVLVKSCDKKGVKEIGVSNNKAMGGCKLTGRKTAECKSELTGDYCWIWDQMLNKFVLYCIAEINFSKVKNSEKHVHKGKKYYARSWKQCCFMHCDGPSEHQSNHREEWMMVSLLNRALFGVDLRF